ncbi:MAG: hypothetical protein IBJ11_00155 [Phycisphaerales bacterium]|nr:hypothetical protein [Phycisphaerales bacterium]
MPNDTRAIVVTNERQGRTGCAYTVLLRATAAGSAQSAGGGETSVEVTLSWADYEHWSHGVTPPARVVEAVVGLLLEKAPASMDRPKIDAAAGRRLVPGFDRELAERL